MITRRATVLFYISYSLNSVNYRNLIPTQVELQTLRQLLNDKTYFFHRLQGKEQRKLPKEDESQEIVTLEKELDKIKGVLHPIRRCPSDVLQIIFERTVLLHATDRLRISHTRWFITAIRLSHVCRRWRSITLETPGLWSKGPPWRMGELRNDMMKEVVSRIRGSPAHVRIWIWCPR
jgi:hypothetical protein